MTTMIVVRIDKEKSIRCYNNSGVFHRERGPAVIKSNIQAWMLNGMMHRVGGPALVMKNGQKEWWFHGHRHRLDGPAIERANGQKEWWIYGVSFSEQEFKKEIENKPHLSRTVTIDGVQYSLTNLLP